MSISEIQSVQMVYEKISSQKSTPTLDVTANSNTVTDTVTISDAAREKNQNSVTQESGQIFSGNYQLWLDDGSENTELMYIPEEFSDLYPYVVEPVKLGMRADTDRSAAYANLSPDQKEDLSEYLSTVSEYYREVRDAAGIESNYEFRTSIKNNEILRNDIHQSIKNLMLSDSRTVELMNELGVDF